MSKGDIRYHSGPFRIFQIPLTASESFVEGEPVRITDAGRLAESTDDPVAGSFLGFALASGDTVGSTDPIGSFRYPGFKTFAPSTLPTTNDLIPVLAPLPGCVVIGRLKATTPSLAVIGEFAGLDLTGGVWTFEENAGNPVGRIVDALDANQISTNISGATGVYVLVAVGGQNTQLAGVTATGYAGSPDA